MIVVTKELTWCSAHRVFKHENKCSSLHGHSYKAAISVTAPNLDPVGRVVDFSVIRNDIGAWIDSNWDHTTLLCKEDLALIALCKGEQRMQNKRAPYIFDGEPTAENIAACLYNIASKLMARHGVRVVSVSVYESETSCATVSDA